MKCILTITDSILSNILGKKDFYSYAELVEAFQERVVDPGGIIPLKALIKFGDKEGTRDNFGKIYTVDGKIRMTLILPKSTEFMNSIRLLTAQGSALNKKEDLGVYTRSKGYIEFEDINQFVTFYMGDFMHVGRETIEDKLRRTSYILSESLKLDKQSKQSYAANNFRVDVPFLHALANYANFLLDEAKALDANGESNLAINLWRQSLEEVLPQVMELLEQSAQANAERIATEERPTPRVGVVTNKGAHKFSAFNPKGGNLSQIGRKVLMLSLDKEVQKGNVRIEVRGGMMEAIHDVDNLTAEQILGGVVGVPQILEDGVWKNVYLHKSFRPGQPNQAQQITTNREEAFEIGDKAQMYFPMSKEAEGAVVLRKRFELEGPFYLKVHNVQSSILENTATPISLDVLRVDVGLVDTYPYAGRLRYFADPNFEYDLINRTPLDDAELEEYVLPLLRHTYTSKDEQAEAVEFLNNLISISQEYVDRVAHKKLIPSREISFYVGPNGKILVKAERFKTTDKATGKELYFTHKDIKQEEYSKETHAKIYASLLAARVRFQADLAGNIVTDMTQVSIQDGRVVSKRVNKREFYQSHVVAFFRLQNPADPQSPIVTKDVRIYTKSEVPKTEGVKLSLHEPRRGTRLSVGERIKWNGFRQLAGDYPENPMAQMVHALIKLQRGVPNIIFVDNAGMIAVGGVSDQGVAAPGFYNGNEIYINLSQVQNLSQFFQVALEEITHSYGAEIFGDKLDPRVVRLTQTWQMVQGKAEAVLATMSPDAQVIVRHHLSSVEEFGAGFVRKEFIEFLDKVDATLTAAEKKQVAKGIFQTFIDQIKALIQEWFGKHSNLTKKVVNESLDIIIYKHSSQSPPTLVSVQQPLTPGDIGDEAMVASVNAVEEVMDPEGDLESTEEEIKEEPKVKGQPAKPGKPKKIDKSNLKKFGLSAPLSKLEVGEVKGLDARFADFLFRNDLFVDFVQKSLDPTQVISLFNEHMEELGYDTKSTEYRNKMIQWGNQSKIFTITDGELLFTEETTLDQDPEGDTTIETEKNESQATTHDRTEQKKSSFELADAKVRAFIKMTPAGKIVEQDPDNDAIQIAFADGSSVYYDLVHTETGEPKLVDYTSLWNRVQSLVQDSTSLEEMLEKMSSPEIETNYPEIFLVAFRLRALDDSFESHLFRQAFFVSFSRTYVPTYILDVRKEEVNGGEILQATFQPAGTIDKRNIETQFFSTFQEIIEDNFAVEKEDGFMIIDFKNLVDFLNDNRMTTVDKWDELGFPISEQMRANSEFVLHLATLTRGLADRLAKLNRANVQLNVTQLHDLINKTIYPDNSKPIEGRNTEWNAVLNSASNLSELTTSNMVKNAENENQSNLHIWSSFTIQLNRLKKIFREAVDEASALLKAAEYIPRLGNPMFQVSQTRINLTANNLPQVINISGTRFFDGQDYDGTSTISLNQLEYEAQQMFTTLKYGVTEILRPETANTSLGVKFNYGNSPLPIPNEKFRDKAGRQRLETIFLNYLRGELAQRKLETDRPYTYGNKKKEAVKLDLILWGFLPKEFQQKLDHNNIEATIVKYRAELVQALNKELDSMYLERKAHFEQMTGAELNQAHPVFKIHALSEMIVDLGGVDNVFQSYFFNQLILNIEHIILSHGDLSQFDKFYKRGKSNISSGTPVYTDEQFYNNLKGLNALTFTQLMTGEFPEYYNYTEIPTAKSMILKDDIMEMSEEDKKRLEFGVEESMKLQAKEYGFKHKAGLGKKVADTYSDKLDITDGEAGVHPDFYRMILNAVGSWTPEMEIGYRMRVYSMKLDPTEQEIAFMAQVNERIKKEGIFWTFPKVKFQMRGNYIDPKANVALEGLDKFSLTPLWPDTLGQGNKKGFPIFNLMTQEGVAYYKHQSGAKIATFTPDDLLGRIQAGEVELTVDNLTSTHRIILENLKEQVKTADHYGVVARFGTQQNKLIISSLKSKGKYVGLMAKAVNQWKGAQKKMAAFEREKLLKELKYKDGELDLKAFANLIEVETTKRDMAENIKAIFEKFGEPFYDKFEAAPSPQLIETLLYSILQSRIKDKVLPGYHMIQVSSPIYDTIGQRDLKFYRMEKVDGKLVVRPAECKITLMGDFKNLLNLEEVRVAYRDQVGKEKKGEYEKLTIKRLILNQLLLDPAFVAKHEKALTVYSYRIPTQGFNSMDVMIVKEFLSTDEGPMIIPPPEIVKKSGTDYDHDKMPTVFPSISRQGTYLEIPAKELSDLTIEEYKARKANLEARKKALVAKEDPDTVKQLELKQVNDELFEENGIIKQLLDKKVSNVEKENLVIEHPHLGLSNNKLRARMNSNVATMAANEDVRTQLKGEVSKELKQVYDELHTLQNSRTSVKKLESNQLIEAAKDILLDPLNFARLVTPNSTGLIRPVFEEILSLKGISQVEPFGFKVVNPTTHLKKWYAVKQKDNLGIGAQANTLYSLLQDMGVELGAKLNFKVGDDVFTINSKFSIGDTNLIGNPFLSTGEDKLQYINEYINLTVDAAADDIAGYTNLHQGNAGLVLFELMQGVPIRNTMMLVEQPAVIFFEQKINQYMFEGMTKSEAQQKVLEQMFPLYINGYPAKKKEHKALMAKGMQDRSNKAGPDVSTLVARVAENVSFTSMAEFMNNPKLAEDRDAILSYLILQKKSDALREFKSKISFDTTMPVNYMHTADMIVGVKNVVETGLFTKANYEAIRDHSAIAHTWTADLFGDFSKAIFKIKRNRGFMIESVRLGQMIYDSKGKESFYRDFDNDFLLSIVQNFGEVNQDTIIDLVEGNLKLAWDEVKSEAWDEVKDLSLVRRLQFSKDPETGLANPMFIMGMENSAEDWDQVTQEMRTLLASPNSKVAKFAQDLINVGVYSVGYSVGPYYLMKGLPHEVVTPMLSKAMDKFQQLDDVQKGQYILAYKDKFIGERGMKYSKYFLAEYNKVFDKKVNVNKDFKKDYFNSTPSRLLKYYDLNYVVGPIVLTSPTSVTKTNSINVYYAAAETDKNTRMLSNLAERRFTWEGREYGSVEHAYQSLKSGTFDQATYNKYVAKGGFGTKIRGKDVTVGFDNLQLMKDLVVASFVANPNSEAVQLLIKYNNFTHNTNTVIDQAFLEGLTLARNIYVKPKLTTVDKSLSWGVIKDLPVFGPKGINTMRKQGTNEHFGNPFTGTGVAGLIQMLNVPSAVQAYTDWLNNDGYEWVNPEQRNWIQTQIKNQNSQLRQELAKESKLLYMKDKGEYDSHADALARLINVPLLSENVQVDTNLISRYEVVNGLLETAEATLEEIQQSRYPMAEIEKWIRATKYTPESIAREISLPIGTKKDINPSVTSKSGKAISRVVEDIVEHFQNQGIEFEPSTIHNMIVEFVLDPKRPTIEQNTKQTIKGLKAEMKEIEAEMKKKGLLSAPLSEETSEEVCRINFDQPPI